MKLGFLVDLHLCMGCKGCEIACKVENEVPLSTWRLRVKYVDVGSFPETRRTFTPLRCNHCENAPCDYIDNGIVNIDKERCIGCAGCVMACPYGAIYIDPETQTADKCTYCAHRVASSMMPACVVACPVEANIFGDIEDPTSNISKYIQSSQGDVQVRKPEKGTNPHHYYVGGGNVQLNPLASHRVEGHSLFNKLTHLPLGGHH